jgi:DNA-binding transcriptional MerR regulator
MNPSSTPSHAPLPVFEGEGGGVYSVEVLARLSGVDGETILLYHERGVLPSVPAPAAEPCFDDEGMRRLRRLESLRELGGMNLEGICLVGSLLDVIDDLRAQLARRG